MDKIGGFYEAVAEAKRLGGLPKDQGVRLVTFPGHTSPFEAFQHIIGVSAVSIRTIAAAAWVLGDPRAQSLMDEMMRARAGVQNATVMAPQPIP